MKKFDELGKGSDIELTEDDLDAIEKIERQKNIDGQVDESKEENDSKKDNKKDQIRKEHAKEIKETLVKSLPLLFLPSTLHPCPTWLFK